MCAFLMYHISLILTQLFIVVENVFIKFVLLEVNMGIHDRFPRQKGKFCNGASSSRRKNHYFLIF